MDHGMSDSYIYLVRILTLISTAIVFMCLCIKHSCQSARRRRKKWALWEGWDMCPPLPKGQDKSKAQRSFILGRSLYHINMYIPAFLRFRLACGNREKNKINKKNNISYFVFSYAFSHALLFFLWMWMFSFFGGTNESRRSLRSTTSCDWGITPHHRRCKLISSGC